MTKKVRKKYTPEFRARVVTLNRTLPLGAELAAKAVHSHWAIENNLHWSLDVIFREDGYRLYSGFGPLNMAILKRFAKNLLQKLPGKTLKRRMIGCALNDSIREQALFC